VNILPGQGKGGRGSKRYGVGLKGTIATGGAFSSGFSSGFQVGGPAPAVTVKDVFEYRMADGSIQFLVFVSNGKLMTFNEDGTFTTVKSGLSSLGTLGAEPFNSKLIFYNGIDNCFSWDGTTCTDLGEYVEDVLASDETWVSTSSFTLKPGTGRAAGDYPDGRTIKVTFASAGTVSAVVDSTSYDAGTNTLTVNVTGTPFPGSSEAISRVEYFTRPPAFSFLKSHLDMLWGLTPGELKAKRYRGNDGMKAYFQAAANNENSWYLYTGSNPTQEIPFINLRNKVETFDELVAMSVFEGNAVFHARGHLIIYTGDDPFTAGGFQWAKTIPVGTVHQKLVRKFPGDILFVSPYGARSLRTVFQTENEEVVPDLGSDIDPTIQEKVQTLLASDDAYKKAKSFYYAQDGFYGFKLDDDSCLIYALTEESKGWVEFKGYFSDATGFLGTTDGRLLLTRDNKLYAYANGTDEDAGRDYSDDGNNVAWEWGPPWLAPNGARWANNAWEILLEDSAPQTISIDRFINFNFSDAVTTDIDIAQPGAQFDDEDSQFDDEDTQFDGMIPNPVVPDEFLADAFTFRLRGESKAELNVLGVRPIGR